MNRVSSAIEADSMPRRQLGDPDEVVAIARSGERELDVGTVADVGALSDRAPPAPRGERGRVAVGQGEVDVVGDVDLRGEAGGGRLDFDLLARPRSGAASTYRPMPTPPAFSSVPS